MLNWWPRAGPVAAPGVFAQLPAGTRVEDIRTVTGRERLPQSGPAASLLPVLMRRRLVPDPAVPVYGTAPWWLAGKLRVLMTACVRCRR